MKTNVPITVTDEQRSTLADLIDGKQSKRLATRAEITGVCQRTMMMIIDHESEVESWPAFDAYLLETCGAVFNQEQTQ